MPLILGTNSIKDVGYEVDNSLRFNDGSSDYLSKTPSGSGNRKTNTISVWVKRANAFGSDTVIFSSGNSSNVEFFLRFNTSDQLEFYNYQFAITGFLKTNRVFRDPSAWMHIVAVHDTSNSTADDRMRLYINGVQETSFATRNNPSSSADLVLPQNLTDIDIGRKSSDNNQYFDGYMAEFIFVDGQALDSSNFGEFDEDTNIWKPKDISEISVGTHGFYFDFSNSSNLGEDQTGSNDYTVNNLTSIDQSTDTCTNNFATLNPLFITRFDNDGTFSEGNLKISFTSANSDRGSGFSTIGVTQGKWYWEVKVLTALRAMIGVGDAQFISAQTVPFYDVNPSYAVALNGAQGALNYNNTSTTSYHGSALSDNDIVQVALDMDNHLLWFGINGTWLNSATQTEIENSTATNDVTTDIGTQNVINNGEAIFPFVQDPSTSGQANFELNFGNPPFTISSGNSDGNGYGNFEYSVPSGYYALNTKNLAEYG